MEDGQDVWVSRQPTVTATSDEVPVSVPPLTNEALAASRTRERTYSEEVHYPQNHHKARYVWDGRVGMEQLLKYNCPANDKRDKTAKYRNEPNTEPPISLPLLTVFAHRS